MGNFFTSTQIYNPNQLDSEKFKEYFCEKMQKDGYEICDSEPAELSYILSFADNCKWVALTSESYEQGNELSQKDTSRIAKMLKTACINTTVIDSDCAVLDLYDNKGEKADTVIMGQADDYYDEIPQPKESAWKSFIADGCTFEQFCETVNNDNVFVEDGLSRLAPVINADSKRILFEFDSADSGNSCTLSFRKTNAPKEKKLTLKSAFVKVFGEYLEPFGYKKVKGGNADFVRVIDNEIIQLVSLCQTRCTVSGEKNFYIQGKVYSMYNTYLELDVKPEERYFQLCNRKVYSYQLHTENYDFNYQYEIFQFRCKNNNDSIMVEMEKALDISIKELLPFIHSIDNIDALFKYCMMYDTALIDSNIEFIYLKLNNYASTIVEAIKTRNERYKRCVELQREGFTQEEYERIFDKSDMAIQKRISQINEIRENPELYKEYKLKETKAEKNNMEILKKYGIL